MGKFIINRVKCFVIAVAIVLGILGGYSLYFNEEVETKTVSNQNPINVEQVNIVEE
ncbi:MAG: hypothetical protein IJ272_08695 [Clostridia bacterium]|nr:hypothetical protein [Clostridia bacterium]